jgi:hypothetical protein
MSGSQAFSFELFLAGLPTVAVHRFAVPTPAAGVVGVSFPVIPPLDSRIASLLYMPEWT